MGFLLARRRKTPRNAAAHGGRRGTGCSETSPIAGGVGRRGPCHWPGAPGVGTGEAVRPRFREESDAKTGADVPGCNGPDFSGDRELEALDGGGRKRTVPPLARAS